MCETRPRAFTGSPHVIDLASLRAFLTELVHALRTWLLAEPLEQP